jgi:hypothetical protein
MIQEVQIDAGGGLHVALTHLRWQGLSVVARRLPLAAGQALCRRLQLGSSER